MLSAEYARAVCAECARCVLSACMQARWARMLLLRIRCISCYVLSNQALYGKDAIKIRFLPSLRRGSEQHVMGDGITAFRL